MTLGTWTIPAGSRLTTTLRDIKNESRTYGGSLRQEILAQKHDHTLEIPIQTGVSFDELKTMKETDENVSFVYPDENGTGNITETVSIGDLNYVRKKEYNTSMWIDKISLSLEEV